MELEAATRYFLDAFPAKRFVLGVSGGRDSMALLDVFRRLLPPERLAVAHFNHRLRGAESDGDEAFVEAAARASGVRFSVGHGSGVSAEAECRDERHAFLESSRFAFCADFVVLAHHAQDQLETFLMRVLRGTGLDGLGAMASERGRVLRPWLSVAPSTIAAHVENKSVVFRHDGSNSGDSYLRNRVRQQVVPPMERLAEEFGGADAFFARFSAMTAELRGETAVRTRSANDAVDTLAVETPLWTRFPRAEWLLLEGDARERFLRRALARLGTAVPSRERLSAAVEKLASDECEKLVIELGDHTQLTLSCGFAYLRTEAQRRALSRTESFLRDGTVFRVDSPALDLVVEGALPDGDHVECRFLEPGDRYRGVKLKRLLLEYRVPEPERALVPVLAARGSHEVLWFAPLEEPRIRVRSNVPLTFSRANLSIA